MRRPVGDSLQRRSPPFRRRFGIRATADATQDDRARISEGARHAQVPPPQYITPARIRECLGVRLIHYFSFIRDLDSGHAPARGGRPARARPRGAAYIVNNRIGRLHDVSRGHLPMGAYSHLTRLGVHTP